MKKNFFCQIIFKLNKHTKKIKIILHFTFSVLVPNTKSTHLTIQLKWGYGLFVGYLPE